MKYKQIQNIKDLHSPANVGNPFALAQGEDRQPSSRARREYNPLSLPLQQLSCGGYAGRKMSLAPHSVKPPFQQSRKFDEKSALIRKPRRIKSKASWMIFHLLYRLPSRDAVLSDCFAPPSPLSGRSRPTASLCPMRVGGSFSPLQSMLFGV